MDTWLEEYPEERRRARCRREIEVAISEVKGYQPDDPAWREWYRALLLRRRTESAAEQEGR